MSIPIQPMADYVVAQTEEAKSKTSSAGYICQTTPREKPQAAKVLAVGREVEEVKVGDQIVYKNDYEATKVSIDKSDYLIIYRKNIIATVKE